MACISRRLIALLLAFATVFSMSLESAALSVEEASLETALNQETEIQAVSEETSTAEEIPASEETPATEEVSVSEEIPAEEVPVPEETPAAEEEAPVSEETPAAEEEAPVSEETPAAEEAPVSEETPEEEETSVPEEEIPTPEEMPDGEEAAYSVSQGEQSYTLQVTGTQSLTLQYDDRYSFSQSYGGYVILSLETSKVTSYQVSKGSKTGYLDTAVLTAKDGSDTDVIAAGVGSAKVLLVREEQLEEAQAALAGATLPVEGASDSPIAVSVLQVNVTVKPARLTMLYLAGQSNAEGCCSTVTGYRKQDSILCQEGEVYSSYLPSKATAGAMFGGIPTGKFTRDASKLIAGSLTGTKSISGGDLPYALNSLTQAGKGKTGPDSGLAYEWNRLTGDKVWVVNAGFSGSAISTWSSGGSNYQAAVKLYQAANKVLAAEVAAGHYTQGQKLLFWLQGESDRKVSATSYLNSFQSFRSGMTKNCGIQYFGLIMVRANAESSTTSADLTMTGPRIAQYYMGNSTDYSNVYVVSNVNEQWVTDSGVASYFRSAYSGGTLTYPTHSGVSALPKTVGEVHGDKHYSQLGHNENGLTAARTMYDVLKGNYGTPTVTWRNASGGTVQELLSLKSASQVLVPVVSPLSASKKVSYRYQSGLSYSPSTGVLTFSSWGKKLVAAEYRGKRVGSLHIERARLATPTLKKAANATKGIAVTWSKVSGASGYIVFRKYGSSGWKKAATVSTNQYIDTKVTAGTAYTYTVRAYQGDNQSDYIRTGVTCTYLQAPAFRLSLAGKKVQVTWTRVPKATKYQVYRRTSGGSWKAIATLQGTASTYTDASGGQGSYEYAVVAVGAGTRSGYYTASPASSAVPVLKGAVSQVKGVQVSWYPVKNATAYRVYRKSGSSGWKQIAVVSTERYLDTTVKSGTRYTYTVRAARGEKLSSYDSSGVSVQFLGAPVIRSLRNGTEGISLAWNLVSGGKQYIIYRKQGSSGWKRLAAVNGSTYTDTSALRSGITYTYTVRAVNGSNLSAYTGGKKIYRLDTPTLSKIAGSDTAVSITWKSVEGAASYRVYRKGSSGGWKAVGTVTTCRFQDTTANKRSGYCYTVRAVRNSTLSGYDPTGISLN